MKTILALIAVSLLVADVSSARPHEERQELATSPRFVERVGIVDPAPLKATADTSWIADWTFDGVGGVCDDSGWVTADERNLHVQFGNMVFWSNSDTFDSVGNIQGQAAILGAHDLCWSFPDGYDNNWYQGMCIQYVGESFLSFDYLIDSESSFDFLQVETDSACSSFDRLTQEDFTSVTFGSASLRTFLWATSGFDTLGVVDSLLLSDHGAPADTHCVYVSFFSDGAYAPSDGLQSSTLGVAAVVDNLVLDGAWPLVEDFSSPNPRITYRNMHDDRGVGDWARLYQHITDNDLCDENTTCAWLWTDDQTPTYANDVSMAFGPGNYVIKNWLQDAIIGPWVSLASSPSEVGTVLSFRIFPGNFFNTSRIVLNWSVRGRKKIDNSDTPTPGDSVDCVSEWGHASSNVPTLSDFHWETRVSSMSANFDPTSTDIQMRFTIRDYQFRAGAAPPSTFLPGPGPFIDRIRIGRLILEGPDIDWGIDARYQAQDAFPTQLVGGLPGQHHEPSLDRFGTTAFTRSADLAVNGSSPNLITGDSITVKVTDLRGVGGVTSVDWFACIVSGPHTGKAPPPYTVQANGFFQVGGEMCRNSSGVIVPDRYFVDLDDEYFRGGDVLLYYWAASDALGGRTSLPKGISGTPADVAEAELLTGGLLEVSFLPTIQWDPAYLARIAADPHGKLDPTPQELANSEQATCLLYAQMVNMDRRSGDLNRTSFQYTLDQLGYRGFYDTYDLQGLGNTNNQLGGRATVEQAEGYSLIIYDAGVVAPGSPILPDGVDLESEKIDQITWFEQYLAAGMTSAAGRASIWMIGANALEERPLEFGFMSTGFVSPNQGLALTPTVSGEPGTYTFASGVIEDFSTDDFPLHGSCRNLYDYDALSAISGGVVTHRYRDGANVGDAAVVMASDSLTATNTVMMSMVWADVRDAPGIPGTPEKQLAQKILAGVLPNGCLGTPTDIPNRDDVAAVPARTTLHQNTPNPFNPTTRIAFDLAKEGRVSLRIYDVAGRLVRTLLDEVRPAGYGQFVIWDGDDSAGHRLASGIYFYHLETHGVDATRKLVVMK